MPKLTKRQKKLLELHKEFSDEEILQVFQTQPIQVSLEKEWSKQDDAACKLLKASTHWKTLIRVRDRMKQQSLNSMSEADVTEEQIKYLRSAIQSFESYTVFIEQHAKLATS